MLSPAPTPTAAGVWRFGQAVLWGGLLSALALTLAVATVVPERALLVPVGLLALGAGAWVLARPVLSVYIAVGLFATALNKADGLQLNQVLYGLFAYAVLAAWYVRRWATGEAFVHSWLDRCVGFMLFIGTPLWIGVGIVLGADLTLLRGEVIAFTMLAFYFPVKEVCRQEERGPEILVGLILLIAFVIVVRNMLSFREIVLEATMDWQIADARPGEGRGANLNEAQLMAGALASLALLLNVRSRKVRLVLLALFGATVFGLVMTRSRGYWVSFALGLATLFFMLQGRQRRQIVVLMLGGGLLAVVGTYLLLGPRVLDLVVGGTLERFSSLGSATTQDPSLLNRFRESASASAKAIQSPLLGWGFGSTYVHHDLISQTTSSHFFIHNGYVALWFKHGLLGLAVVLAAWAGAVWQGLQAYRSSAPLLHRIVALAAVAWLIATVLSASTSNPFPLRDQKFFLALHLALAVGLYQRYRAETRALPPSAPEPAR